MLFNILMMLVLQQTFAPGMTVTPPTQRGFSECVNPLAAEGAVSSDLTVACSVRNGRPEECRIETGTDLPSRQRTAARCLAREYRFTDTATGAPANGPVTIPIALRVQVR